MTRKTPLLWEYGRNDQSFAYAKGRDRSPNLAMRDGQWELLASTASEAVELYDLASDPQETKNLAEQHLEVAGRLRDTALPGLAEVAAVMPGMTGRPPER
jgi:arylsulfatase A-like enzyme